ncbi:hypothetical protein [Cupriavidus necator]
MCSVSNGDGRLERATKTNLAILIGVTDYVEEELNFPACENNVSIMRDLLLGSGKFSVIVLPSDDARILKSQISDVIGNFRSKDIGELFFYFTGQGEFFNDGLHFMLRDYSAERFAQTTLENSELDRLLESLCPTLVVKVVDAYFSRAPYLKCSARFADRMMDQSQSTFSKCYFLSGLQAGQRPWLNGISDLTREFVKTVANSSLDYIRYKDVIDRLLEAFVNSARQSPLYFVHGRCEEVFGLFSDVVRQRLKDRLVILDKVVNFP